MEEGFTNAVNSPLKVVITGPESAGKSTLAESLASHYGTVFVPEYARAYVENLSRPYRYDDLEHIARQQIQDVERYEPLCNRILFMDTYLIITKVWFNVVYNRFPGWLDEAIRQSSIHLFLLCSPDLPWEPDAVRENGGEMRNLLFKTYQHELEHYQFNYRIIEGFGENRLLNAVSFINDIVKND